MASRLWPRLITGPLSRYLPRIAHTSQGSDNAAGFSRRLKPGIALSMQHRRRERPSPAAGMRIGSRVGPLPVPASAAAVCRRRTSPRPTARSWRSGDRSGSSGGRLSRARRLVARATRSIMFSAVRGDQCRVAQAFSLARSFSLVLTRQHHGEGRLSAEGFDHARLGRQSSR
jgi:hypothetical protein